MFIPGSAFAARMLAVSVLLTCLLPGVTRADVAFKNDPWIGKQRALVVLLEWRNHAAQVSVQDVHKALFGMEPGDLSMRQYFLEGSAGRMDMDGDILPWKRTGYKWSRLFCASHGALSDASDNFLMGCSPKEISDIAWDLVKDQVNVHDYDLDGDGKIDHLFVVHTGRLFVDRVGPDRVFYEGAAYANEVVVFQSQGLGSVGTQIPIGFFLHESGHNLFLLGDYYGGDGGYNVGRYGIGMWGIMGLGAWGTDPTMSVDSLFRYPSRHEAPSLVRIGWANTQVFTRSAQHVRLRPVELTADVAVVPMGTSQDDSFYLEYRTQRGFSAKSPGQGMLLWKGPTLVQADGRDDLNHGHRLGHRPLPPNHENFGDSSDPFPGSLKVTSYQDSKTGIRFENIVQTDEAIELDIVFPSSSAEAESNKAVLPALRNYSASFKPVSLNGAPWPESLPVHPAAVGPVGFWNENL